MVGVEKHIRITDTQTANHVDAFLVRGIAALVT